MRTKVCKYCQAIIPKANIICPICGKSQNKIGSKIVITFLIICFIGIIGNLNNEELKKDKLVIHENSQVTNENDAEVSIEEQLIYDDRNVKIYVKGIEKSGKGYNVNIYIENTSSLNLGFNAHAYSVNKIMTNNNIYSMNCDVAAGKKANAKIEIGSKFIENYKIMQIETIDILFWAYDNDKGFKSFDTAQITLETNLKGEDTERIIGTNIYSENGLRIDYLYNSDNKYTYCLTNETGTYVDFDIENVTINDFTSSEIDYDLVGTIVLNDCQSVFTIEISEDFRFINNISTVEKIEFTISVRPFEDYSEEWHSDMILLEL